MDPCPSRLEPPRDSGPLADPCSSRQETVAKRLEPARGTPGLEGLVHNTSYQSVLFIGHAPDHPPTPKSLSTPALSAGDLRPMDGKLSKSWNAILQKRWLTRVALMSDPCY